MKVLGGQLVAVRHARPAEVTLRQTTHLPHILRYAEILVWGMALHSPFRWYDAYG